MVNGIFIPSGCEHTDLAKDDSLVLHLCNCYKYLKPHSNTSVPWTANTNIISTSCIVLRIQMDILGNSFQCDFVPMDSKCKCKCWA